MNGFSGTRVSVVVVLVLIAAVIGIGIGTVISPGATERSISDGPRGGQWNNTISREIC